METTPILHINMLGGCSLSYGDSSIDDARYHAKKPWTLLEYLIAFRSREIPLEERAPPDPPESRVSRGTRGVSPGAEGGR